SDQHVHDCAQRAQGIGLRFRSAESSDGCLIVLDGRSSVHAYIKTHAHRRADLTARAAEHDAADTAVETIAQADALALRQGVLVEGIASELQERAVDLRRKAAAGEQVCVVL